MTLTGYPNLESILPTPEEAKEAKISTDILASYLENNPSPETLKLIIDETEGNAIAIPAAALPLLVGILSHLSQGNTVKLTPITKELADYQVADILGVSPHYVWELMNSGKIPYQIVDNCRQMHYEDVMEYKQRTYEEAQKALDEMVAEAEAMGLYD
ncbi:MAG: helix-turn-helix domain-containing protein [Cyanobacteriota bacterium]|nr:helix-turn-helix domain-containing protein [Cyanobacteriota bacterium]